MDFSELSARAPWRDPEIPAAVLQASALSALAAAPRPAEVPSSGAFDLSPGLGFHTWPELFLQLAGSRWFHCPGGAVVGESGMGVLVPRGVPHQERGEALDGDEACLVVMPFSGRVTLHVSWMRREERVRSSHWAEYPDRDGVSTDRLCDELAAARHAGAGEDELTTLYQVVLHHLQRVIRGGELRAEGGGNPLVARTRRLVTFHLHEPDLGVERLARELGVSPDHLGRRFRAETGETLVSHIARRRIDTAAELLAEGRIPIRAAAWSCGFRDPQYFSRVFRRLRGTSPREWSNDRHHTSSAPLA
ncbi:MAG: helix-turn-helix transcriptional regulator [Planctomycetes bacterium]|nr:helix-turn-helix transcriptional regulator [Planctomycetota bacterium]